MSYGEPKSQRELTEAKDYARSRLAMKRAEERSASQPTYQIAHGGAAVQAARIVSEVARERDETARAYYLAAQWHDKQATMCNAVAKDEPRIGADAREKARSAAIHHGASAAGLRLAATSLLRGDRAV